MAVVVDAGAGANGLSWAEAGAAETAARTAKKNALLRPNQTSPE